MLHSQLAIFSHSYRTCLAACRSLKSTFQGFEVKGNSSIPFQFRWFLTAVFKYTMHGKSVRASCLFSLTRWWVSMRGGVWCHQVGRYLRGVTFPIDSFVPRHEIKISSLAWKTGILWTTVASCFTVQACPSSLQWLCYKNMDIPWPSVKGEFEDLCTLILFTALYTCTYTHICTHYTHIYTHYTH